jgi:long-chain acyl-CoA synthetase
MRTVADILRWRARVQPDMEALCHGGRRITYRQLEQAACRTANALIACGVRPGDRIAVLDKGHDRLVETIFGIAKTGAVFTPINWRLTAPEIVRVMGDAGATVLFVGQEFAERAADALPQLPAVRQVVGYDTPDRPWLPYDDFVADYPDTDPMADSGEQETVWQLYTSGTTGLPRGVELTHANLFSMCTSGLADMNGDPQAVVLASMPLFHIGGSGYLLHAFYCGARVVLTREANPLEMLDLIERERVSHALFVPAMLSFMLRQPNIEARDFSSLQLIIYGASPIADDVLTRSLATFRCRFIQAYGLTETTGSVAMLPSQDHVPGNPRLRSCGLPILGHMVRVVRGDGSDCATGEVGEIIVRGHNVMKGYWNRPDATAEVLKNGWFHTGDAGYLDADGYLYIHDRIKDMIVSGGENIYPAEVENVLCDHPAVAEAAVIGVPDDTWGETVKAVIVLARGCSVTEAELTAYCGERLAGYKRPRSFDFVTDLPRTPSGKILKRELRAQYWKGRARQVV